MKNHIFDFSTLTKLNYKHLLFFLFLAFRSFFNIPLSHSLIYHTFVIMHALCGLSCFSRQPSFPRRFFRVRPREKSDHIRIRRSRVFSRVIFPITSPPRRKESYRRGELRQSPRETLRACPLHFPVRPKALRFSHHRLPLSGKARGIYPRRAT